MVIQSHIQDCTRTVLCVTLIKMWIVSSVLISPWERVWFTHTGWECGCTRPGSSGTTAENFFARPQYSIFAVHSCICELKYGCMQILYGPRWSASNRFGFFRLQDELSQNVCVLIQYSTVTHSEFSPVSSNMSYDGLWGHMVWLSAVRIFLATTRTCTKATGRSVSKCRLFNQVQNVWQTCKNVVI